MERSGIVALVALTALGTGAGTIWLTSASRDGRDGRGTGDEGGGDLVVTWGGEEGRPSCAHDPASRTVLATLSITGRATGRERVAVTVTAYADENTSQPVGSATGSTDVEGEVDTRLLVTIPVTAAPHVDADGESPCTFTADRVDD